MHKKVVDHHTHVQEFSSLIDDASFLTACSLDNYIYLNSSMYFPDIRGANNDHDMV